jgi:hypothetical protein
MSRPSAHKLIVWKSKEYVIFISKKLLTYGIKNSNHFNQRFKICSECTSDIILIDFNDEKIFRFRNNIHKKKVHSIRDNEELNSIERKSR